MRALFGVVLFLLSVTAIAGPRYPEPCGRPFYNAGCPSIFGVGELSTKKSPIEVIEVKTIVSGSLERDVVRRYLKRDSAALLYCYEKELLLDPSLEGEMTLQFEINTEGLVSSSSVKKGSFSKVVSACVSKRIEELKFSRAEAASQVSYQLRFENEDATKKVEKKKPTKKAKPAKGFLSESVWMLSALFGY